MSKSRKYLQRRAEKALRSANPFGKRKGTGHFLNWNGRTNLHGFSGNPAGAVIALLIFFMVILFWTSGLPGDPFNADPNFISQWTLFYNSFKWYLTVALPFAFMAMAIDAMTGRRIGGISVGGGGLAHRLLSARARSFGRPAGPVSPRQQNIFVNAQITGAQRPQLTEQRPFTEASFRRISETPE